MRFRFAIPLTLTVAQVAFSPAPLRSAEPAPVNSGAARLPSGLLAPYEYHFDRNSLRDSRQVGDAGETLVALTSSGNLLRFEWPAVRLAVGRAGPEEFTCLGRGDGDEVLAGLADGRVCRVDPVTLEPTTVATLPAAPRWVGRTAAGLLAVVDRTKTVEHGGRRWERPVESVIHDPGAGKTVALGHRASTFLFDSKGRLWLGSDNGEWGGRVARYDTGRGTLTDVKAFGRLVPASDVEWEGVYGFVERTGGVVWAFGGTSYMGFHRGFITRIDEEKPRRLATFTSRPGEGRAPDPDRPSAPVSHIVEDVDGGLFVLSYGEVFRTDAEFKAWKKVHEMDLHYRPGRPDAVGSYPAVTAVHPLKRQRGRLLFATIGDGYVGLDGVKETRHALAGQIGTVSVERVEDTAEGTLAFDVYPELPPWRFRDGGWHEAALAPPFEPAPGEPGEAAEDPGDGWNETVVLVGPKGAVFTVSASGWSPGTRTTARRQDGKPRVLGREQSSIIPQATFVTPDGELWSALNGDLSRFAEGRWQVVSRIVGNDLDVGWGLKVVGTSGPPWVLLDRDKGRLLRLAYGDGVRDPRLTALKVSEGDKELAVSGAIPWLDGTILLATGVGLRTYRPDSGRVSRAELPEPPRAVRALARDGAGRLWMAGDGLWMVEHGGESVHAFDALPGVGRGPVEAMAADPGHDDGVVAALGARGIVFVRASVHR